MKNVSRKTEEENWSPQKEPNSLTDCKAHSLNTKTSAMSTRSPKCFAQVGESHDVL